ANGTFSPPIVPPFNVGDFTGADGINDARTVCGFFLEPDDTTSHGYFFSQGAFTQFDIEGAVYTNVASLNDAGDFTGTFETDLESSQGYVDIGGNITFFSVPGASFTFATSINGLNEIGGGYRIGTETNFHGYLRDESGNLDYPIDFPGSLGSLGTLL